ncbi:MAG: SDR family oxidoreductase [Sphingomonadales bacterium]|nr:SDR family oxidoreductase [Sphingomonadales bacterium]
MTAAPNFSLDLSGQVALVTGASSGLGERFARVLAACGAKVAIAARRRAALDRLADDIAAEGGTALPLALDMRDIAAIPEAVARAEAALGPVSILVNNAGVTDGRRAVNMTPDLIDAVLETNLRGPYVLACEVTRRLIAANRPGRIVNVGSIGAFTCSKPGQSLYSVSKAGIVRMTEVLAVEWAPHFINVNAIAPGTFHSEMTGKMIAKLGDLSAHTPRKRYCDPAQLDSTLLFLVSPSSEAVTGTVIKVDDGQTGR